MVVILDCHAKKGGKHTQTHTHTCLCIPILGFNNSNKLMTNMNCLFGIKDVNEKCDAIVAIPCMMLVFFSILFKCEDFCSLFPGKQWPLPTTMFA